MLVGSNAEKISKSRLANLSTFGILGHFRQPEVIQLLDALGIAELIQSEDVDRFRPVVNLTPAGRALFKDPEVALPPLILPDDLYRKLQGKAALPAAPTASRPPGTARVSTSGRRPDGGEEPAEVDSSEVDPAIKADPLYEELRALRTAWARDLKQSPFTIFTNQTLVDLTRARPRTPHDLGQIKGMGSYRLEKYGAAILAAINGSAPAPAAAPNPVAPTPAPPSARPQPPALELEPLRPIKPPRPPARDFGAGIEPEPPAPRTGSNGSDIATEEWTGRLLDRGFTAREAALIRGLEPVAILRQALKLAQAGRPIPIEAFVGPADLERWDERFAAGFNAPHPDWEDRPGLWALFLACRRGGQA